MRRLDTARRAPRRPEVQEHDLARGSCRERLALPSQARQAEVRRRPAAGRPSAPRRRWSSSCGARGRTCPIRAREQGHRGRLQTQSDSPGHAPVVYDPCPAVGGLAASDRLCPTSCICVRPGCRGATARAPSRCRGTSDIRAATGTRSRRTRNLTSGTRPLPSRQRPAAARCEGPCLHDDPMSCSSLGIRTLAARGALLNTKSTLAHPYCSTPCGGGRRRARYACPP